MINRASNDIDFRSLEKEIRDILGDNKIMVLATGSNGRVTARSMSCITDGLNILFQTDRRFTKIGQILENPHVALCYANVQIEGRAELREHPLDGRNRDFLERFKRSYGSSYEKYSHLENEVVVEVKPELITLWKYEQGRPLRDFLYLQEKKAIRAYYL